MRKIAMATLLAGSMAVSACSTYSNGPMSDAGPMGYPGPGPGPMGVGYAPIQGGVVGAPIGGLAGGMWADGNNDGIVDGYSYNGYYYQGAPAGWNPNLGRVGATMAAGTMAPSTSALDGAIAGAVVAAMPGAIWADRDGDGRVDGYMYNGQYYAGAPGGGYASPQAPPPPPPISQPSRRVGERG